MKRLYNVEMKDYTSFKAGGRAAEMVIPETTEELQEALREIALNGRKSIILGNGSNTLIADSGFDGAVVKLGEAFCRVTVEGGPAEGRRGDADEHRCQDRFGGGSGRL